MQFSLSVLVSLFPFFVVAGAVTYDPGGFTLTTPEQKKKKLTSKKNPTVPPTTVPTATVPPMPTRTAPLIALIGPIADDINSQAVGTTTFNYNPDGSFLVSVDLSSVTGATGTTGGVVVITNGTSCDTNSPDFSTVLFGHPAINYNNWAYQMIGNEETGNAMSFSAFRVPAMAEEFPTGTRALVSGLTVQILAQDGGQLQDGNATFGLIGCGVLQEEPIQTTVLTTNIGTYPGYDGEFQPTGTVTLTYPEGNAGNPNNFVMAYDLQGVVENCSTCGIHLHVGTSCANEDEVGGHYWNSDRVQDLWTTQGGAIYSSSGMGEAEGYFQLNNGYGYLENHQHVVTVHSETGTRVGCGVLMDDSPATSVIPDLRYAACKLNCDSGSCDNYWITTEPKAECDRVSTKIGCGACKDKVASYDILQKAQMPTYGYVTLCVDGTDYVTPDCKDPRLNSR